MFDTPVENFLAFYLIGDSKGENKLFLKKTIYRKINNLETHLSTLIPKENVVFLNINLAEIDNIKSQINELNVLLKHI